jgi:hypothetical protein
MTKELPAPELLRKLLRYEPDNGKLFWLERPDHMFASGRRTQQHAAKIWNTKWAGREAFTAKKNEYRVGAIFNILLRAHRVIWAMQTKKWPEGEIDHINGDKSDNRFCNLRLVNKSLNQRNCKIQTNNTSGYTGVTFDKRRKKWVAQMGINKTNKYLGQFDDRFDAVMARLMKERQEMYHMQSGRR